VDCCCKLASFFSFFACLYNRFGALQNKKRGVQNFKIEDTQDDSVDSSQDLDKKIPRRYDYEQLRTLVLVQYDSKIQERNLLQSSKSHKSTQRPLKYNVLIISYYKAYKYSTPLIIVPDLVRQQ